MKEFSRSQVVTSLQNWYSVFEKVLDKDIEINNSPQNRK